MTGNNILLDTNIVIAVFDGNKDIADKINKLPEFYITSIVLGELYIGVNRVTNKIKHLKKVNDFLKICSVLDVDSVIAAYYSEIVAALYKKGKPIPTNAFFLMQRVK
jgi:tRNA(fMet)-specific endonuclease VapC